MTVLCCVRNVITLQSNGVEQLRTTRILRQAK
uniref:Uncharacterized protein n=1 Tax=Rhizophora mucronata TaxID=61149 RepID=A0A2P2NIZ7_RHIMU